MVVFPDRSCEFPPVYEGNYKLIGSYRVRLKGEVRSSEESGMLRLAFQPSGRIAMLPVVLRPSKNGVSPKTLYVSADTTQQRALTVTGPMADAELDVASDDCAIEITKQMRAGEQRIVILRIAQVSEGSGSFELFDRASKNQRLVINVRRDEPISVDDYQPDVGESAVLQ